MNKNVISGLIFSMILIDACTQQDKTQDKASEKGFLEGRIRIGPLCPVERIPPDSNCQPTEETYSAWPIAVFDGKTKVAHVEPKIGGSFKIELPPGNYVVDLEKTQPRIGGNNLPAEVIIKSGETTTLNIDIDTGIR